jgi:hypothetical protein
MRVLGVICICVGSVLLAPFVWAAVMMATTYTLSVVVAPWVPYAAGGAFVSAIVLIGVGV